MANPDHEQLIDEVFQIAKRQLIANDRLDFTVLTLDEHGLRAKLNINPECFQNDVTKEHLARKLRSDFERNGVVRYAVVAECWVAHLERKVADESLEDYATRALEEYAKQEFSPSRGDGRDEALSIYVCDRRGSTLRMWRIERNSRTGAVRDLAAFDDGANDSANQIKGRFVNLLEGQVH